MQSSFSIARVFGIDVRVHVTFLFIVALGALQWSSFGARGIFFGVALTLLLFTCVVLHELGHSLVAKHFDVPVKEIVLLPIGGVAKMLKQPARPLHELLIAIAGPLVNVVIVAILLFVASMSAALDIWHPEAIAGATTESPTAGTLLGWLIAANAMLALFNMIPALPMDGGRVLRAALEMALGRSRATEISTRLGQVLAVGMGLVGFFTGHFVLMLIAAFVYFGAGRERAYERVKQALATWRAGDIINPHAVVLAPNDSLGGLVPLLRFTDQVVYAVVHGERVVGTLTRDRVLFELTTERADQYVAGVMERRLLWVPTTATLDNVRDEIIQHELQAALVHDAETKRFVGVISLADLDRAAQVAQLQRTLRATPGFGPRPEGPSRTGDSWRA